MPGGAAAHGKTVNIFGHDVGTGISRDMQLVGSVLAAAGYEVVLRPIPANARGARAHVLRRRVFGRRGAAAANIFMQDLVPGAFNDARLNVFVPNQEWFDPAELRLFPALDVVACKSMYATDMFSHRGTRTLNLGFTALDRLEPLPAERRTGILHVAGRSPYKGADAILEVWRRHPEWPTLTLTHGEGVWPPCGLPNVDQRAGHLDDEELRRLQNEAWLHLQPSEMEAFGHALCEGMSVGALVLTTDAPPMNELIRADRGALVDWNRSEPWNMGRRFYPDPDALEARIAQILAAGRAYHAGAMTAARKWYLENDKRVKEGIVALISSA